MCLGEAGTPFRTDGGQKNTIISGVIAQHVSRFPADSTGK